MTFTLENVVPWGRSFEEYVVMFSLSKTDLEKRILGCGDGPAGFNADFPDGARQGRYVNAQVPFLPFRKGQFGLVLSSHFLFLYSVQLSFDFHLRAIEELCRVARQVRIFPLLELGAKKSRHLDKVVETLDGRGFACSIEKVNYEFQKGGNQMLTVKPPLAKSPIPKG